MSVKSVLQSDRNHAHFDPWAKFIELILQHGADARALVETKTARQAIDTAAAVLADEETRLGITHAGFAMTSLPIAVSRILFGLGREDAQSSKFDINAIIDYTWDMRISRHPAPASITIRNLDPALKERLRIRAAQHGQSMEAEARRILQTALAPQEAAPVRHLYDRVRARFAPLGGIDLELPPREPIREPPRFE